MKQGKLLALFVSVLWIASMSESMAIRAINANFLQNLDWILSDETKIFSGM